MAPNPTKLRTASSTCVETNKQTHTPRSITYSSVTMVCAAVTLHGSNPGRVARYPNNVSGEFP
jgi:hypothetical protein